MGINLPSGLGIKGDKERESERERERVEGGDVAQLVDHRTGTLPTQVRFPGAARSFLLESTSSADSLTVSVKPRVNRMHLYLCAH